MRTVSFKSNSESKIKLLIKAAKEIGVESVDEKELTDEDMALPGKKPTKRQFENWLMKDDGESYGLKEGFEMARAELKKRLKKSK